MTTPGGVPNLPAGALTLDTLASKTQDMSGTAMKNRAVERFPSIFDLSTGLSPVSDLTPFGILTRIWAEVNSLVANADPADIQGPEDLPELVLQFIEGLPVVGQFVDILAAILGNYNGEDPTLIAIQNVFAPIRAYQATIQQLIDTLVNGFAGGTGTGNNPAAVGVAMASQVLAIPGQLLEGFAAFMASLQGQQTSAQNNAGVPLTDDFASAAVTGYTNIVGTITVANGGIQRPALTMAYRNTGPATDRHGAQIVIDGKMRGTCGVFICSNTTGTNYAALHAYSGFAGDSVRLVTGASPTLWVVQKQFDFLNPTLLDGDLLDVWYDLTTNTFHVTRNLAELFTWPDVGGVVTHGSTKRKTGLISNAENRSEVGYYGPRIKKFTTYDK